MVLPYVKSSDKPEIRPCLCSHLTTHVLQHHPHNAPLRPQVGGVEPVSDVTDTFSAADFTHRRAWKYEGCRNRISLITERLTWVNIEQQDAERLTPAQLINEEIKTFLSQFGIRRPEVE